MIRQARRRRAPCLVGSPARSTWTSSSSVRRGGAAAASTFFASDRRQSIEWIASKRRPPSSPCSTGGGRRDATGSGDAPSAPIFWRASCTLFSPKSTVRRRRRRGRDRRRMSWRRRRAGLRRGRGRPGRPRARCDRERRPAGRGARRDRALLLELRRPAPSPVGGVRAVGASFRYVSNSVTALRHVALVHERHPELVMRLGVVRIGRDRLLERFFASAILPEFQRMTPWL